MNPSISGTLTFQNKNKVISLQQMPKNNLKTLSIVNLLMTINILFLSITISLGLISFYVCIAILLTTLLGLSLNIFCLKSIRKKDIWEKTEV
jgi:hypothetical protein